MTVKRMVKSSTTDKTKKPFKNYKVSGERGRIQLWQIVRTAGSPFTNTDKVRTFKTKKEARKYLSERLNPTVSKRKQQKLEKKIKGK